VQQAEPLLSLAVTVAGGGLLNKQVGGQRAISEITVKAHRGQVMQKMKADSLANLAKMAGKLEAPRQNSALVPRQQS